MSHVTDAIPLSINFSLFSFVVKYLYEQENQCPVVSVRQTQVGL